MASATVGSTADSTLTVSKPIGSPNNGFTFYTGIDTTKSIIAVPIFDANIGGSICGVSGSALTSYNYIQIDTKTVHSLR